MALVIYGENVADVPASPEAGAFVFFIDPVTSEPKIKAYGGTIYTFEGPAGVGTPGVDGSTILSGTAVPTTEGADGDFYVRTTTMYFYGPKAAGVWPAGVSLVGPAGPGATVPTGTGVQSVTAGVIDVAARPIGAASATDILDRQSGDARFSSLRLAKHLFNIR